MEIVIHTAETGASILSDLMSTGEAADALGLRRETVWKRCRAHPGFAVLIWGEFKIPRNHVERVLRGESFPDIAAEARARNSSPAA